MTRFNSTIHFKLYKLYHFETSNCNPSIKPDSTQNQETHKSRPQIPGPGNRSIGICKHQSPGLMSHSKFILLTPCIVPPIWTCVCVWLCVSVGMVEPTFNQVLSWSEQEEEEEAFQHFVPGPWTWNVWKSNNLEHFLSIPHNYSVSARSLRSLLAGLVFFGGIDWLCTICIVIVCVCHNDQFPLALMPTFHLLPVWLCEVHVAEKG